MLQKPFYANNKFEESVTVENKAKNIVLITWENLHWNNPVEFHEEGNQPHSRDTSLMGLWHISLKPL